MTILRTIIKWSNTVCEKDERFVQLYDSICFFKSCLFGHLDIVIIWRGKLFWLRIFLFSAKEVSNLLLYEKLRFLIHFINAYSSSHYQKIIMLLRQCEYSMTKNHLSYLMNIQERKNYETLYKHIGTVHFIVFQKQLLFISANKQVT